MDADGKLAALPMNRRDPVPEEKIVQARRAALVESDLENPRPPTHFSAFALPRRDTLAASLPLPCRTELAIAAGFGRLAAVELAPERPSGLCRVIVVKHSGQAGL
jgi:hypothetical protein